MTKRHVRKAGSPIVKQAQQTAAMLMNTIASLTKKNEQLVARTDKKLKEYHDKLNNLNTRLEILEGVTTDGTTNRDGNGDPDGNAGGSQETSNSKLN